MSEHDWKKESEALKKKLLTATQALSVIEKIGGILGIVSVEAMIAKEALKKIEAMN